MIKVIAVLFVAALSGGEPRPFAQFVSHNEFETVEKCKEAAPAIVGETVKQVNEKLQPYGMHIVSTQMVCGDPKNLQKPKEDNSI